MNMNRSFSFLVRDVDLADARRAVERVGWLLDVATAGFSRLNNALVLKSYRDKRYALRPEQYEDIARYESTVNRVFFDLGSEQESALAAIGYVLKAFEVSITQFQSEVIEAAISLDSTEASVTFYSPAHASTSMFGDIESLEQPAAIFSSADMPFNSDKESSWKRCRKGVSTLFQKRGQYPFLGLGG